MFRLTFLTFFWMLMITSNVTTAIILLCTFVNGGFMQIGGVYYCTLSSLKTTSHTEMVTGSTGTHLPRFNNDGVKGLHIVSQICNFLPRHINGTFANLEGLAVADSGLQHITKKDLSAFPKWRGLWLGENSLSVLEQDLFIYNTNLEHMAMQGNKLMQLDSNLLTPLPRLYYFDLQFNYCINFIAVNRTAVLQLPLYFKNDCQDEWSLISFVI